jgi:hypothetical protein
MSVLALVGWRKARSADHCGRPRPIRLSDAPHSQARKQHAVARQLAQHAAAAANKAAEQQAAATEELKRNEAAQKDAEKKVAVVRNEAAKHAAVSKEAERKASSMASLVDSTGTIS